MRFRIRGTSVMPGIPGECQASPLCRTPRHESFNWTISLHLKVSRFHRGGIPLLEACAGPMSFFQAETLRVDQHPDGTAVLWIDVPGRPINVFTHQLLADLDTALDRVAAESAISILAIRSAKASGFLAGADLRVFAQVKTAAEAAAMSALGQALFDKVAGLRVPVVAVVAGPCLGGGLELALACDYRL